MYLKAVFKTFLLAEVCEAVSYSSLAVRTVSILHLAVLQGYPKLSAWRFFEDSAMLKSVCEKFTEGV